MKLLVGQLSISVAFYVNKIISKNIILDLSFGVFLELKSIYGIFLEEVHLRWVKFSETKLRSKISNYENNSLKASKILHYFIL